MKNSTEQTSQDFLKKCLRNWYFIIPFALGALVFAKYLLAKEQAIWNVTGSIIVQEDKSGGGQLPEEAIIQGLPFKNKGNLDKQIEILKSRKLMERVVDSLGLDILYFREDRFKMIELYKHSPVGISSVDNMDKAYGGNLRIKMMDESRFSLILEEDEETGVTDTLIYNYGVPFNMNGVKYNLVRDTANVELDEIIRIQFISPRSVAAWFSSRIGFQKKGMSNVLRVNMNGSAPDKIVEIIYNLVDVYNVFVQEEKNKIAAKSLNFINDRLNSLSSELFVVEGSQASFKSTQDVTTDVGASAERYIQKLNDAESALDDINNTQLTLSNLRSFLNDPTNQYEPIPRFGDLAGISFAPLISSYNRVIVGRRTKLINVTQQHPDIVTANNNLVKMKQSLLSGINLANSELSTKEQDITEKKAPVERKVANMPYVNKTLNKIGREKSVKEELVVYMLQKREETAIGLATEVDNTRVLDDPVISPVPVGPNSGQYYMMAFLLGFGIPVGFIYLLDRLNDKVRTKEELKALTQIPFLGEVAYAKSERNKLITADSNTVITEMFRLIRTNLMFLMTKGKKNVITITSNESGDGKTFVATNLGICLSLLNKKTVMLELDLRKPKLTERLIDKPSTSTIGITNYLVGENGMDEIINKVEGYPNLHLISSGPTPPNPAELIMSDKMTRLIDKLKEDYEYIVIDTPPIGLVADAYLLNRFTSSVILVTRSGKTKRKDIENIDDIVQDKKLIHPAIILNGTKIPKRYGYYY